MMNWLVQIPGPKFLLYFLLTAGACIFIGWLLIRFLEEQGGNELPELTHFHPSAFSYLRDSWEGVISAALFSLHQKGLAEITEEEGETVMHLLAQEEQRDCTLSDPVEKAVYNYLRRRKRDLSPLEILNSSVLINSIQRRLDPVLKEMEDLNLLRTEADRLRALIITVLVLIIVMGFAGIKMYFGLINHKPADFLALMMMFAIFFTVKILKPYSPLTSTGEKYLEQAQQQFMSVTKYKRIPDELDLSYTFACCGIVAVAGMTEFDLFYQVFAPPPGSSGGGGCGGGGCGGGGCGGGGCGGGGCGG